mmetsp:Transcript_21716/g.40883  ORF Transcript_21716/g.40883 Transcript_21716/m.40883 type:complete len:320 (+) Transcript_21716:45-1004(+)
MRLLLYCIALYCIALSRGYSISTEKLLFYSRKGSIKLNNVLPPSQIKDLKSTCRQHIKENELITWQQKMSAIKNVPLSEISSNPKYSTVSRCKSSISSLVPSIPFLQYFNLHKLHPSIKSLTHGPLLPSLASSLMATSKVRLYQDSLFYKRPSDAETLWHSDLKMTPFDTNKLITFWIPLTRIPASQGLQFVDESHLDFALPFWHAETLDSIDLGRREGYGEDNIRDYSPINLGSMTAHNGWTLHSAPPNFTGEDRLALAISYVDGDAVVREGFKNRRKDKGDREDEQSYEKWIGGVKEGKFISAMHVDIPIIKFDINN